MKKLILVITIIVFIFAISFGVYFAWEKSQEILNPPAADNQSQNYQFQPQEPKGETLKILSDQTVFAYWTAENSTSSEIFYINESGQILKIKDKEDEIISDRPIENLQQTKANKNGSKIIVKQGASSAPKFEIFDIGKKIWQSLNNASAADFSPDGKSVAYLENTAKSSNLMTKDLSSSKQTSSKILSFNQKDFDLKWLASDKIFLIPKPSSEIEGEIWEVDIKKKTLKLFDKGLGLTINWSKDSSYGLRFVSAKPEGKLNLIDSSGAIKANINFLTLPEKCWVSLVNLYCAVFYSYTSKSLPILPDDYLKKAVYFEDKIYSIDLNKNSFEQLNIYPQSSIDAVNLSVLGKNILFINRYDKKIYQLGI